MFAPNNSNSVDFKFIVVYDKSNKPVANSIKNQARDLSINSTSWSKEQYLANEPQLNNDNFVLFLSESLIEENLSNPQLQLHSLIEGVNYKKQGNAIGIFVEDINYIEAAKRLGDSLKEDWLKLVGVLIATGHTTGLKAVSLFATLRYKSKKKKAKLYLLFKASNKFTRKYLKSFVSGELNK